MFIFFLAFDILDVKENIMTRSIMQRCDAPQLPIVSSYSRTKTETDKTGLIPKSNSKKEACSLTQESVIDFVRRSVFNETYEKNISCFLGVLVLAAY